MKKQKEVWIKFRNMEEYIKNGHKLLEILDKAPGNCSVVAYIEDSRSYKKILGCTFDENRISLLAEAFGEESVKCQEKEWSHSRPKKLPWIMQLIPCSHEMYAVITDWEGMKRKCRVLMYALCSDGEVYPLHYDESLGVSQIGEVIQDVESYEMADGQRREGEKLSCAHILTS